MSGWARQIRKIIAASLKALISDERKLIIQVVRGLLRSSSDQKIWFLSFLKQATTLCLDMENFNQSLD